MTGGLLVGCGKVKEAAGKLRETVAAAAAQGGGGVEMDAELEALVDKSGEGYVFRRDLEFPGSLEVRTVSRTKLDNGRLAVRGLTGNVSMAVSMTAEEVRVLGLEGSRLRLEVERQRSWQAHAEKTEDGEAIPGEKGPDEGKALGFRYDGGRWRAEATNDFAMMAWGREREGEMDLLVVEEGVRPRHRWLGERRMGAGDKLVLTGDVLKLVFSDAVNGRLELEFVKAEGVKGHPCGVFSLRGEVSLKSDSGGEREVTVTEGKVWMSLLHPVVLKTEMETIQSTRMRLPDGSEGLYRGAVEESVVREWRVR